jgi:ATP diphosphatase
MPDKSDFSRLVEIMAALRDPQTGCPWDVEQDFDSIRHYTIEEAYEVADAIERRDWDDLRDELGDLILQPVYHAQMASEQGLFDIGEVVHSVCEKLIRRHPHVFGDIDRGDTVAQNRRWEEIKAEERASKAARREGPVEPPSLLDDVPDALAALARSVKLAKRGASVGFDWPDTPSVADKCREELREAEAAIESGDEDCIREEIGDLLFSVANLARHAGVDAEAALRDANVKFKRRFRHVEARCREDGVDIAQAGLGVLDGYWNEVRKSDKG